MQRTKIEYLTHTYNPIAMRCTPISHGCAHCWHLAMAKRLTANPLLPRDEQLAYAEDSDPDKGPPVLRRKELEAPLHLRKPARIGVQLMGDLFHESIKGEQIERVFSILRACQQHIFLILTKRPQNINKRYFEYFGCSSYSNLWLGVSVEDQKTADERIPLLLQIPAAHRWVSVEPMLGPVNIPSKALCPCSCYAGNPRNPHPDCAGQPTIDWVIAGGETGPGARPLHPDWVRSLRDQCQATGVPFFFKHWGEWAQLGPNEARQMVRVGHKHSGHLLDDKEWREFPK